MDFSSEALNQTSMKGNTSFKVLVFITVQQISTNLGALNNTHLVSYISVG